MPVGSRWSAPRGLALADLSRTMVAAQGYPDLLFTLVELSYLHGQAAKDHEHSPAVASDWPL